MPERELNSFVPGASGLHPRGRHPLSGIAERLVLYRARGRTSVLKPPPHASLRLPGRSMVSLNASLDRISSLSDWAFGKDPLVPTDSPRIPPSPGGASIDFNELGLLGEDLLPMGDEMARLHRFLCRSLAAASTSSPPRARAMP